MATDQALKHFTAHRDALLALAHIVPAMAAAWVITKYERYAHHAVLYLQAWFISPETSMTPSLEYAQVSASGKTGRPEGVLEAVHLAEVAQSILFLSASEALTEALKYTTRRERPDGSGKNSFPSGHAADTFAFATAL